MRILCLEVVLDAVHLRLCLGKRHALAELGDRHQVMTRTASPRLRKVVSEYPINLVVVAGTPAIDEGLKFRWEHTGDYVIRLVESDGLAGDRGVGTIASLPQSIGEDDYLIRLGRVLLGGKVSSQPGADAQRAKEIIRDAGPGQLLSILGAVSGRLPSCDERYLLERLVL